MTSRLAFRVQAALRTLRKETDATHVRAVSRRLERAARQTVSPDETRDVLLEARRLLDLVEPTLETEP
jgi:hypothetical protein